MITAKRSIILGVDKFPSLFERLKSESVLGYVGFVLLSIVHMWCIVIKIKRIF